jgi:hypothetical protein
MQRSRDGDGRRRERKQLRERLAEYERLRVGDGARAGARDGVAERGRVVEPQRRGLGVARSADANADRISVGGGAVRERHGERGCQRVRVGGRVGVAARLGVGLGERECVGTRERVARECDGLRDPALAPRRVLADVRASASAATNSCAARQGARRLAGRRQRKDPAQRRARARCTLARPRPRRPRHAPRGRRSRCLHAVPWSGSLRAPRALQATRRARPPPRPARRRAARRARP